MKLPHWFPEVDFLCRLHPIVHAQMGAFRYSHVDRTYVITEFRLRMFCWRSVWAIDWGFQVYKREVR